jgi:transposase/AraC-like DNA-binding protein
MAARGGQVEDQRVKRRRGRVELIGSERHGLLNELVTEFAHASLDELTREFKRRTGVSVCVSTMSKGLKQAGIKRIKPARGRARSAKVSTDSAQRVGYTARHRRAEGISGMNTDLTDAEWALVADLFERRGGRGKPPTHERRVLLNACCYVVRTGCAWRLLPKTFPHWRAVYKAFSGWSKAGTFEAMHDRLRQQWRDRMGRNPDPTVAVIDAQSTRSTAQGGDTGFDAGKKVKGRKRHLVVDTLGLVLAVSITSAGVQDRDAASAVVAQACTKVPGLTSLYADAAYGGQCAQSIEAAHGIDVHIVRHPGNRSTGTWQTAQQTLWPEATAKAFIVQARRWVVERTHAWNERSRRLIAHHDRSNWAPTAWVWLTEGCILASRLAERII